MMYYLRLSIPGQHNTAATLLCFPSGPACPGARAPTRRERRTVDRKVSVSFLFGRLVEHGGLEGESQIAKPPEPSGRVTVMRTTSGQPIWEHRSSVCHFSHCCSSCFLTLYTACSRDVMFGHLHKWISVVRFSCVTWRSRMSCVRKGFLWGLKVLVPNPQRSLSDPDGIV